MPLEHFCTASARVDADDVVVDVECERSSVCFAKWRERRKPSLEDRLIARMLAPWLDGELARGLDASLSEAHAARAEQLAGEGTRRAVARELDRLIERAEYPRRVFLIAATPREQVLAARPVIRAIASRLRADGPLPVQGIARLKGLLRDRSGPCHALTTPDALTVALQETAALLESRTDADPTRGAQELRPERGEAYVQTRRPLAL